MDLNPTDILAVIGAAYALALVIVKLTPTPRDDDALARVSPILRALAKVFGLTLKQGVTKGDAPTGRPPLLPMLALLVLPWFLLAVLTGCASVTPERQYVAAAHTYGITCQALSTALRSGDIPRDQVPAITAAVHTARDLLDQWAAAIDQGQPAPDIAASLQAVIANLQQYLQPRASP